MSWPQWSSGTQPSVPPVLNPTTPVINSAPAVVPPGLQYTPDQWAQLQQQNWNQWAQWQQQYQQWHQQYGAEYQKSMNALAQAAQQPIAGLPNVAVPPPLPVEAKPPLPIDDPPPPVPAYTSAPPQGYSSAPVLKSSERAPQQPFQRNNQNWNQNYRYEEGKRQQTTSKAGWQNQAPAVVQQPAKVKESVEELSEAEKKFDKQFAEWEAQFNKWKEQNAEHPDKEQYREYEKKWESWRAQLLERREQMKRKRLGLSADSPNRNKAGFNQSYHSPQGYNQVPAKAAQGQTKVEGLFDAQTSSGGVFNKPPPTLNDEPLKFKDPKPFPELEESVGDFIKPNTGGGIPGLDLVKDDFKPKTETEDVMFVDPEEKEKKGPDFDAISKGINSILGDQKLLNMLSMVTQTQNPKINDNMVNAVSRTQDGSNSNHQQPFQEQSNQSFGDHSNHSEIYEQREFVNNFDDQTRSSFTTNHNEYEVAGNFNRNQRSEQGQFPNRFGGFNKGNRFGGPEFEHAFGKGDRYPPGQDRFNYNQEGFGPDQERFGQHQERFGPNQNRFGMNQDRFGPNQERFATNQDRFGSNQERFGPNQERFGPNQERFGPNQSRFAPNQDRFGPNQDKFPPNQERFGPNLSRFPPNHDRFGQHQGRFPPKQDQFGPNQARFGPKQDRFDPNEERFDQRECMPTRNNEQMPYEKFNAFEPEENYDNYDYDEVAARYQVDEERPIEPEPWKPEIKVNEPVTSKPDVVQPKLEIFQAAVVTDYEHKPPKQQAEAEVLIEPLHMFDYRHKPLSRIPLPQRPKWLLEAVRNIREFDPPVFRPYEPSSMRRYPPPTDSWRNDGYNENWTSHGRRNYDNRSQFERRRPYEKSFEDSKTSRGEWNSQSDPKKRDSAERRQFQDMELDEEKISDTEWPEDEPEEPKKPRIEQQKSDSSAKSAMLVEDLICPPGRYNRPPRIVIILRGPPGSGKTFLAKLIKDKEVENGGSAPRILSLDDYFMVEQEKEVTEEGKKVKIKEMVYEYEAEMEDSYRMSLIKSFKKTVTDGYFSFIIVDNINDKVKYFGEMWSFAKQNGFQVYICQLDLDVVTCSKRNIHGRTEAEIEKCVAGWEATPSHHPILDVTSLLQSASIPEVEMEEVNSPESDANELDGPEDEVARSKWDNFDCSVDNLAKLDGVNKPLRTSRTMEEYLQLDTEWTPIKPAKPGQKRVRWADLEEQKQQEKMRAIGFVVGHTNWDRMMDPTGGSSALTQTKYIERTGRYKVDPK